jgi:hypothetical protein
MAKEPKTTAAAAGAVDDETMYRVKLKKVVRYGEAVLTPNTHNVVKGKVLKGIEKDAVESYEEA